MALGIKDWKLLKRSHIKRSSLGSEVRRSLLDRITLRCP